MNAINGIRLSELVTEQEAAVMVATRERVARLVADKIKQRDRIKELIAGLQEDLKDAEAGLTALRTGDWSLLKWEPDSAEK